MKNTGGGGLIVNYASDEDAYPERAQRVEGSLLASDEDAYPERAQRVEGSLLASDEDAYPERAQRVEGSLLASDQGCLSRATIGSEGSLLESDEDSCPEEHRDDRPVPTWSGRFRPCRKGSLFTSQWRPTLSPVSTWQQIPPAAPRSPASRSGGATGRTPRAADYPPRSLEPSPSACEVPPTSG